jgi:predicted enzyme related to lactoylglutathione lyase
MIPMAKLRGPDFISLAVRDLAASRAFYTETLGLTIDPRFDATDFVLFDTNSIPFALCQAESPTEIDEQPGGAVTLWLDCDDADALHAALVEHGISIAKPPFDGPFGRTFTFIDPDGYRLTANQNPWDRFPLGGLALGKSANA